MRKPEIITTSRLRDRHPRWADAASFQEVSVIVAYKT